MSTNVQTGSNISTQVLISWFLDLVSEIRILELEVLQGSIMVQENGTIIKCLKNGYGGLFSKPGSVKHGVKA